jgi:hypothetical protein
MHGLSPGTSPPPVKMPIVFLGEVSIFILLCMRVRSDIRIENPEGQIGFRFKDMGPMLHMGTAGKGDECNRYFYLMISNGYAIAAMSARRNN